MQKKSRGRPPLSRSGAPKREGPGRPATQRGTVHGTQVAIRLSPEEIEALDRWIADQAERDEGRAPTRAEAARRLIALGLEAEAAAGRRRRPAKGGKG